MRSATEQRTITEHFLRVEADLRRIPGNPDRRRTLDHLRDYRERGRYPTNTIAAQGRPRPIDREGMFEQPPGSTQCPVFVDGEGTRCAVAHLIEASGRSDLLALLAAGGNGRYVDEMDEPELAAWIAGSGLTREEVARIQPAYCFDEAPRGPDHPAYIAAATVGSVGGVALGGASLADRADGEPLRALAIADLAVGAGLVGLGAYPSFQPLGFEACPNQKPSRNDQAASVAAIAVGAVDLLIGASLLVFQPREDVAVAAWVAPGSAGVRLHVRR